MSFQERKKELGQCGLPATGESPFSFVDLMQLPLTIEIIGNTNFGNIDNLLSQGRSMEYIARHYNMDLPLVRALWLGGKTDQEKFEELGWGLNVIELALSPNKVSPVYSLSLNSSLFQHV